MTLVCGFIRVDWSLNSWPLQADDPVLSVSPIALSDPFSV